MTSGLADAGRPVIAKAPCVKCPFRKDVPIYLRRERRREIAQALLAGGDFPCHATVDYGEDEEGAECHDTSRASFCAGAAKALLQDGIANQVLRVMERLGLADLDVVQSRGAEVWGLAEWQSLSEGDTAERRDESEEDVAVCSTVKADCLAPAGFAVGGGVVLGTVAADETCAECGDPVCSNCISDDGLCGSCAGWFDDDGGD